MKILLHFLLVQLILILMCSGLLFAQTKLKKRSITEIKLYYDTLKINGFDKSFPVNLWVNRKNGKQATTPGLKNGTLRWDQFNIRVDNGVFKGGNIHFDPKKVYQNGHQISVEVSPKNNSGLKAVFTIPIPYLTRIVFQPYLSTSFVPGYNYPLDIQGFYSNGQVYSTSKSSNKHHKLIPQDFRIDYLQYSSRNGDLYLPTSLQPYPRVIKITGIYLPDTSITTQIELPVSYTSLYTFNFVSEKGKHGENGENAYGCNRGNGRDGQHGQHGQRGQRGKTVKLYAQSIIVSSDTLIRLKAITPIQSYHILLHTKGKLTIDCRGGDGGDGGKGGNGSDGQDETKTEPAGYGGNGGSGGDGGDGGDGGKVIIYTDSLSLPLVEEIVSVENKGGKGGQGGKGGKRGRGGYKVNDTSFLTALGNLIGINSGNSGNTGYSGQNGEDGADTELIVLPVNKISTHF